MASRVLNQSKQEAGKPGNSSREWAAQLLHRIEEYLTGRERCAAGSSDLAVDCFRAESVPARKVSTLVAAMMTPTFLVSWLPASTD
jgi:hypothetical protein